MVIGHLDDVAMPDGNSVLEQLEDQTAMVISATLNRAAKSPFA